MSQSFRAKTLALAGIFQSASLADSIAWRGHCDPVALEASLQSLLVPDSPDNTPASVYGTDPRHLRVGLQALEQALAPQLRHPHPRKTDILRYAFALIHLERKLARTPATQTELKRRLEMANRQHAFFRDIKDPGMLRNLAGTYVDTIGTFKFRIQVKGSQKQLKTNGTPEQVRAILLTGIRAASLWHHVGGRRWHLAFIRGKVLREIREIIKESNGLLDHVSQPMDKA